MSVRLIAGLVAVGAAPAALFAHHGPTSYDITKPIAVDQPLTELKWGYPHPTAKVSLRKKTWKVVFPPVRVLTAYGLTQEILASGKAVRLVGHPRRDGTAEMRVLRVTVDGKKFL